MGTKHKGKRGSELVAYIGKESGLGSIELGERLRAPPFGVVCTYLRDGGSDAARDQFEEASVFLV
jgi:hypothetical protein